MSDFLQLEQDVESVYFTFYAMRWFFLYIPPTRGRTHTFLKQIIGSDNPRVIIGFTRPKIWGMLRND